MIDLDLELKELELAYRHALIGFAQYQERKLKLRLERNSRLFMQRQAVINAVYRTCVVPDPLIQSQ